MDNLNTHSATDVLLFALAHPRWEFVFQPKYAAYLNLIEPWWKILRSLALKGGRVQRLDGDRARRPARHCLLERAQAPVRLGSQAQTPHPASPRPRSNAKCYTHLVDAPLSPTS